MIEKEFPTSLCLGCSLGKNPRALCEKHSLQDKIFFDFEAYMKTFPDKGDIARCDLLFRNGAKRFIFFELKVADWFFNVNEKKGIIKHQKSINDLYFLLKSKFENSYDIYTEKHSHISKNIYFSVVLSNDYFHQKWNMPRVSISMLKNIIRNNVFRMFSKDYIRTQSYTYKGVQVSLDARDCDEADKLISLA